MRNIWIVAIVSFIIYASGIGIIINEIIKKRRWLILKTALIVGLIAAVFYTHIPVYQDLINKSTITVTAEYVEYWKKAPFFATREAYFNGENGRFHIYVPTLTRDVAKLEAGETYEIEYFRYSRVIKEYRLIE